MPPKTSSPLSTGSSPARAFMYWLVVAIPLTWGVAQSINAALPLFGGKSAYIPWVIGAPPAKPAATASVAPAATASVAPAASSSPGSISTPAPTSAADTASQSPAVAPSPAASPN